MNSPSLTDLNAFVAVSRHLSFRAAADAIGVSRSSLSHAIRGLEEQLGVRLLHRTTRSVAPTEAGQQLLQRLAPMLRELDDLLAAVGGDTDGPVGRVRINAAESGARWLLSHVVPGFLRRHPRVTLDLVSDGRLVDIVADGFDAGVRLQEMVPQDMVIVPFGGDVRFLAVASCTYLAENGAPKTPDDLHRHRCIRQRLSSGKLYRWEFARNAEDLAIDAPGALTLNNNRLMIEAAEAGLGIAFVPEPFARQALEEGRLVALLAEWSPAIPGLCLYYPGHRHAPPALRAFIEELRSAQRS